MLDTILIGTSSMQAHSKGLKVIGNNLANVNTPGFKGSQLEFAALFDQGANPHQAQGKSIPAGQGQGLQTVGSLIDFRAGADQATGDPLDVKIDGNGFLAVKRGADVLYTRNGNLELNPAGQLVTGAGDVVLGLDGSGGVSEMSTVGLDHSTPRVTSSVRFTGNLNAAVVSPPVDATVGNVRVFGADGVAHTLKLSVRNNGGGSFTATVSNALGATVATQAIQFSAAGAAQAGSDTVTFSFTPPGGAAMALSFSFAGVTAVGGTNSLAFNAQDGYPGGTRVAQSIDPDGFLSIQYSNGQTQRGSRLALADFDSDADLLDAGGSMFRARAGAQVRVGAAGEQGLGRLVSGHREGSNVDLAREFSNLIVMQRGYQAASHVVSVANDMIQELFDMKGHR